jgi:putative Holliday junction resolvase|tara:strand:- start:26300 stop:26719 length:420 start_codon:yes stop_codon:yes gene_type:complete
VLAFDFGTRQIGVASGQKLLKTANPLTILRAKDGIPNWNELKKLIDDWMPDQILVGLPLNMDGSESQFCLRARKFGKRLHGKYGVEVAMVDERLSTFTAKNQLQTKNQKYKHKKTLVDDIAAVLILETWLADPSIGIKP